MIIGHTSNEHPTICELRCKFSSTCANHGSAGQFREEDGFTPTLLEEGGNIICATYHEKPAREDHYGHLPKSKELGMLIWKNGTFYKYNGVYEAETEWDPNKEDES